MEHDAFSFELSFGELKYLLMKKKECLKCNGKLIRCVNSETIKGEKLNSSTETFFVPSANVKHYKCDFVCKECGLEYGIEELVRHKKRRK